LILYIGIIFFHVYTCQIIIINLHVNLGICESGLT